MSTTTPRFESVWDAIIDVLDEANDLNKRSDNLILIETRLYGQSGSKTEQAKQYGLPVDKIHDLMNGKLNKFIRRP